MNRYRIAASILSLSLLAAASPARADDADKLASTEASFRKGVVTISSQVTATLASLDAIVKGKTADDRKAALKKYDDDLKGMQKQIDQTEKYAKDMQAQGQAYFKNWEKSMKGVTNADLKASAEERKTAAQAKIKRIQDNMTQAKAEGPKFRQNLSDLQKFFDKSVGADAVATSSKLVDTTTASGKKIQANLDDIVAAIDGKPSAAAAAAATTAAAPAAAAAPVPAAPAAEDAAAAGAAAEAKPAEEKPKTEEAKPEEKAPETPKPPPQALR